MNRALTIPRLLVIDLVVLLGVVALAVIWEYGLAGAGASGTPPVDTALQRVLSAALLSGLALLGSSAVVLRWARLDSERAEALDAERARALEGIEVRVAELGVAYDELEASSRCEIEGVRVSEGRLRAAFTAAPDALILVDAAGSVVLANPAAGAAFARAPGELCGCDVRDLIAAEPPLPFGTGPLLSPSIDRLEGRVVRAEARRPDGSGLPVELRLRVVRREGRVLLCLRDLSGRLDEEGERSRLETAARGAAVAEAAPGGGTRTRVGPPSVEPVEAGAPGRASSSSPPAAGGTKGPEGRARLMLVDDDRLILLVWRRMLKKLGYVVTACSDGEEALALFRAAPEDFDAVITDLGLPGMSGHDLARQLREVRPSVRLLIVTGMTRPAWAADDGWPDEPVLKPATVEEVTETVAALLRAEGTGGAEPETAG